MAILKALWLFSQIKLCMLYLWDLMSLPDSWIDRQDYKSISRFRSVICVIRIYLDLVSVAQCQKPLLEKVSYLGKQRITEVKPYLFQ